MQLSDRQRPIEDNIYKAWEKHANVMATAPTGAGKTIIFSKVATDEKGPTVIIAHRKEIVAQISMALARFGQYHKIIGPRDGSMVKLCVRNHMREFGRCFYDANSEHVVAGVDSLLSQESDLAGWAKRVQLWVMDEGHHIIRGNKWAKAAEMFPNARGLAFTATAGRGDGKGLGRHADGIIDVLVQGPTTRDMINDGYLCDYDIFAPDSGLDLTGIDISSKTGDYVQPQLRRRVNETPQIVGDVVRTYRENAMGELGVTFAVDVEAATMLAAEYNRQGVPAEMVCGKTPDNIRDAVLDRFRNREILQLVNVDLFGEGFDVPAMQCGSFARPSHSLNVVLQQDGRPLRPLIDNCPGFYQLNKQERLRAITSSSKPRAKLFDHVGNVVRHGLPDSPREWTLDRREKRKGKLTATVPVHICPKCSGVFERLFSVCPSCGHVKQPASRSKPEHVDGDLTQLDKATLARMRGEIAQVDKTVETYEAELEDNHCRPLWRIRHVRKFRKNQEAQGALRYAIAWWAGMQQSKGHDNSESYKRFYWQFGIDVFTAQTLPKDDAIDLAEKIGRYLGGMKK